MDDSRLLLDFVTTGSQSAFAHLVNRHVDLVYATALRHVHDAALAEDITQAVFLLLARKAASLRHEAVLPAWLLRATRYASLDAIKLQNRRRKHESEAAQLNRSAEKPRLPDAEAARAELLGMLDASVARLSTADRRVLVLRYYEKRSYTQIGAALGTTEESARKRVTRSIERLKAIFTAQGSRSVTTGTVAVVTEALSECAGAAPAGLAARAAASATTNAFAQSIAAAVTRKMLLAQVRFFAVAACASVVICVMAGLWIHSLLLRHDSAAPAAATPVVEEHDRTG
jgi:RNA polymerase sigma factor (sigma-70 family)